jgi:phosphodiesterase/alkaline phosphatase D-like protein
MASITRRQAIKSAAALGAALAWPSLLAGAAKVAWTERRDLYPQGVASGDPRPDSILLWTRRPPGPDGATAKILRLEVAEDLDFRHIVARAEAALSPEADWTCRVLAAGLQPRPRPGSCGGIRWGILDWRTDLQNLPAEGGPRWPADGFALLGGDDWTGYRTERAEILDFVERERIAGFATVAGDRHSFVAGVLSKPPPPQPYKPVAAEFITGSVSAPTLFEGAQHNLKPDQPWRAVYLHDPAGGARPEPAINLSLRHGVRASLALQKTGDRRQALAAANPEVAPHLSFVDLGGHGAEDGARERRRRVAARIVRSGDWP